MFVDVRIVKVRLATIGHEKQSRLGDARDVFTVQKASKEDLRVDAQQLCVQFNSIHS
jgi:hypothetical protein